MCLTRLQWVNMKLQVVIEISSDRDNQGNMFICYLNKISISELQIPNHCVTCVCLTRLQWVNMKLQVVIEINSDRDNQGNMFICYLNEISITELQIPNHCVEWSFERILQSCMFWTTLVGKVHYKKYADGPSFLCLCVCVFLFFFAWYVTVLPISTRIILLVPS